MLRILAVDDSRTMLETIRLTLEKENYHVDVSPNGQEALSLMNSNQYDVILTDYNMPGMDGIALTKKIRESARHGMVPVIVITTESELDIKMLGKEAGATGWIVKPYRPEQLVAVVQKVT